jgi:hypothetical protein
MTIKEDGINNIKDSGLQYENFVDLIDFNIAQHCSFIVSKAVIKNIFAHLRIPPINKDGSCFYERNFGLYFLSKSITTIDLYNYMSKTHLSRN